MKKRKDSIERSGRPRVLQLKEVAASVGYLKLANLIGPEDARTARRLNRLSKKLRFAAGQQIYPLGDGERLLIVVVEGAINLFLGDVRKQTFVKALGEGSVVGDMPLWGQSMLSTRAVAAGRCEVRVLDESAATDLLQSSLELLFRLQQVNGPTLHQSLESNVDRFRTVESRLARFLIDNAGEDGTVRGLTHADIARVLRTHRETVTKAVRSLARRGWIESQRKKITLLDRDALRELAS